jgi:hypothetical protein
MEACSNFLYPSGTINFYQSEENNSKVLVTVLIRDIDNGEYCVSIYGVSNTVTSKNNLLYFKYIDRDISLNLEYKENVFNISPTIEISNFSRDFITDECIKKKVNIEGKCLVINKLNLKQVIR